MPTLTDYKRLRRIELWEKEEKQFPEGRYQMQLFGGHWIKCHTYEAAIHCAALRVCATKPDSYFAHQGVAVGTHERQEADERNLFNSSFGTVKSFTSFDKLAKAARRAGFPERTIEALRQKDAEFKASGRFTEIRNHRKQNDALARR